MRLLLFAASLHAFTPYAMYLDDSDGEVRSTSDKHDPDSRQSFTLRPDVVKYINLGCVKGYHVSACGRVMMQPESQVNAGNNVIFLVKNTSRTQKNVVIFVDKSQRVIKITYGKDKHTYVIYLPDQINSGSYGLSNFFVGTKPRKADLLVTIKYE